MNGSTMKTYGLNELKARPSATDVARVRFEANADIEPAHDEDSPDVADLMRAEITARRIGRPPKDDPKVFTGIRLDADVLQALRATGKGWQTRVNDVLREWVKAHPQG